MEVIYGKEMGKKKPMTLKQGIPISVTNVVMMNNVVTMKDDDNT